MLKGFSVFLKIKCWPGWTWGGSCSALECWSGKARRIRTGTKASVFLETICKSSTGSWIRCKESNKRTLSGSFGTGPWNQCYTLNLFFSTTSGTGPHGKYWPCRLIGTVFDPSGRRLGWVLWGGQISIRVECSWESCWDCWWKWWFHF